MNKAAKGCRRLAMLFLLGSDQLSAEQRLICVRAQRIRLAVVVVHGKRRITMEQIANRLLEISLNLKSGLCNEVIATQTS
jgi:hypothetical protein